MKIITLTNEFPFGVCPECGHELNSEDINESERCAHCSLDLKDYAFMDKSDVEELLKNDLKIKVVALLNAITDYEKEDDVIYRKELLFNQILLRKKEVFDAIDNL